MKKIYFLICTISVLSCKNDLDLSVATYNVRYGLADDGENSWDFRKDCLTALLNFYNPDIFGIQEGLPFQTEYINSKLPNHSYIGESRDGDGQGEYSAIFYDHDKFKVLEQHTFWLSPTPDKVSVGWDAAYPRICTYGLFKDNQSKSRFWVINTHFDHVGIEAREHSVAMILKKIKEINTEDLPLIFMGDLNSAPDENTIIALKKELNDSKDVSIQPPFGPDGTFNAFQFNVPVTHRIDYIFTSKNNKLKIKKYAVLSDSKDLKYPSDHLPVYVEITSNSDE